MRALCCLAGEVEEAAVQGEADYRSVALDRKVPRAGTPADPDLCASQQVARAVNTASDLLSLPISSYAPQTIFLRSCYSTSRSRAIDSLASLPPSSRSALRLMCSWTASVRRTPLVNLLSTDRCSIGPESGACAANASTSAQWCSQRAKVVVDRPAPAPGPGSIRPFPSHTRKHTRLDRLCARDLWSSSLLNSEPNESWRPSRPIGARTRQRSVAGPARVPCQPTQPNAHSQSRRTHALYGPAQQPITFETMRRALIDRKQATLK